MNRFVKLAWTALAFTVLDILWGGFVRASGSGTGCGNQWPICNGQVIPNAQNIATLIEFTHRALTGVLSFVILALLVWGWRKYSKGSPLRLAVTGAAAFLLVEAGLGAALVKFGDKGTTLYAFLVAIHLLNTFILLAFVALTAWWAGSGLSPSLKDRGRLPLLLGLGLLGVVLLGMSGALTALGDTLYPAKSLADGLAQDASLNSNFLVRLRVIHPIIAGFVGVYSLAVAQYTYGHYKHLAARRLSLILAGLVILQLCAGIVNLLLLAPIWLQIVHLFLADMVWISYVLLSSSTLSVESERVAP